MASSSLSRADSVRAIAGGGPATPSPLAVRTMKDVTIVTGTWPSAMPGRSRVMAAASRLQLSISAIDESRPPKRATERPPSVLQRQLPGVIGASRQSMAAGGGGGGGRGDGAGL